VLAIVPSFIKSIPPKMESAMRVKADVHKELERKKDSVRDRLKSGFGKNNIVADEDIEEMCTKLDQELTNVIEAYLKTITDGGCKAAKDALSTVIPTKPADVGVSLPIASQNKLDDAIERKKAAVKADLIQQVGGFHASWYEPVVATVLEEELDRWGETVRERSKELANSWWRRAPLFVLLIVPVAVSTLLYKTRYCPVGQYPLPTPSSSSSSSSATKEGLLALLTPQTCSACPTGHYSPGGFFSKACQPCGAGLYSATKGAGRCSACPAHSESREAVGSTGCVCAAYATQTSEAGEPLVCKSNKPSEEESSEEEEQEVEEEEE
jgi:hypothetical protein